MLRNECMYKERKTHLQILFEDNCFIVLKNVIIRYQFLQVVRTIKLFLNLVIYFIFRATVTYRAELRCEINL